MPAPLNSESCWAMCFSAAASSEKVHGQHELEPRTPPRRAPPTRPSSVAAIHLMMGSQDPLLHVLDSAAGVAFVPSSVEVTGAELDD